MAESRGMSIVRSNLLNEKGYSPYCGNVKCRVMPRTTFNGKQFKCGCCGWESSFPEDFITTYKSMWDIK